MISSGGDLKVWGFVASPDGADSLAVDSLVDAVGYGFDFEVSGIFLCGIR